MGQRLRTLGERDPSSPVGRIQEVQQAREAALNERDIAATKAREVDAIRSEMRKAMPPKQSLKDALVSLAESIACEY